MPVILIHMVENIGQLLQQADQSYCPALEKHLELVAKTGKKNIANENDLDDLEKRAVQVKKNAGKAIAAIQD